MARTKGSLNKATIAKASSNLALDVDKRNNIVRGEAKVGTIQYDEGRFIGKVGANTYFGWHVEEVLDAVKEAMV